MQGALYVAEGTQVEFTSSPNMPRAVQPNDLRSALQNVQVREWVDYAIRYARANPALAILAMAFAIPAASAGFSFAVFTFVLLAPFAIPGVALCAVSPKAFSLFFLSFFFFMFVYLQMLQ